ncbi:MULTISPECIES: NifU family protein [unclassified Gordonia (in: high G+C Gram-positive bacteria)]
MNLLLLPSVDPAAPATIRWRVGPGLVRTSGDVDAARLPAPLRRLADEGVLRHVRLEPGSVSTTVADPARAATDGVRIRSALFEVLSAPGGWPDDTAGAGAQPAEAARLMSAAADAELADAVDCILHGEVAGYIASHGGHIDLVDVSDGVVSVSLTGNCHGCPAAGLTLGRHLARRLEREPGFRSLRQV